MHWSDGPILLQMEPGSSLLGFRPETGNQTSFEYIEFKEVSNLPIIIFNDDQKLLKENVYFEYHFECAKHFPIHHKD